MRPNGVYTFVQPGPWLGDGIDDYFFEFEIPAGVTVEIVKAWVSPLLDANSYFSVAKQKVSWYTTTVSSVSNLMSKGEIQGGGDTSSATGFFGWTDLREGTVNDFWVDSFHPRSGWTYFPAPEERIRFKGVAGETIAGLALGGDPAPYGMKTYFGMVWNEYS